MNDLEYYDKDEKIFSGQCIESEKTLENPLGLSLELMYSPINQISSINYYQT